jgi:UDP-N-acetylmuramate--alanine ligase
VLGVNERFDFSTPVPSVERLGSVHFIAIGGIGMSGVARLMLERGLVVSGSDAADSPVLSQLAEAGARTWVGHAAEHVDGADTVVVSSAVREDNVELAAARAGGLRVLHRAQALATLLGESTRIAVAGASGKTSTTSMLTVALQEVGADPSFAAGGELARQGTNAHLGRGTEFVVEADESDGSFLVYHPHVAVVTNVQPDHLDFYGDVEHVHAAYTDFGRSVVGGGLLVACADDPGSAELAGRLRGGPSRVLTYGFTAGADVHLSGEGGDGMSVAADLVGPDGVVRRLRLAVPGHHNLLNAAAAYTAATSGLGHDPEEILSGLHAYSGTRRRFEVRGEARGVTVIDDYAHNPAKVEAVVRTAVGLLDGGRLVVVFQPHLFSRTRDFAADFARALAPADEVLLLEVYGAREDPVPGVGSELIAAPLREAGRSVRVCPERAEVPRLVDRAAGQGDVVLMVGAGDVTRLCPDVLAELERA